MRKQGGFTLIELVVVMVILGILAAVALPRFVDMSGQARTAKITAALGSVRSGAALAHAAFLAAGSPATGVVKLEGKDYTLVNGYPAVADIAEIAGLNAGGVTDYNIVTAAALVTINESDPAKRPNCFVTYAPATSGGTPVVITPPVYTATSSGC